MVSGNRTMKHRSKMIYWSEDRDFIEQEFNRMGFDKDGRWRISEANKDFQLCNTYPRFLIIPACFKDEDLEPVAKFRYFRRVPTAVWRHIKNGCFIVRSSQPTVGWFGWFRNELDESLVQSYVNNTMPSDNSEEQNSDKLNDVLKNSTDSHRDGLDERDAAPDQLRLAATDGDEPATQQNQPSNFNNQNMTFNHLAAYQKGHQSEQQQQHNNHNNNLRDASKILVTENGKTIKLDTTTSSIVTNSETNSKPSLFTDEDQQQQQQQPPMLTNENGTSSPATDDEPAQENDNAASPSANSIASKSSTTSSTSKMLIIDARSYTAAMANRAKGGGCECSDYYQRCEVQFMNLANIHSIRKSFQAIRGVCEAYSEQSNNWVSSLDNSRWLHHISGLLKSALLIVDTIDTEGKSILIHCSDGWDRTPQLVALAEIMLDPHYRTFSGFRTLVQREWLDFGHKFADRCGCNPCNEDPNERCPVFLQWLDCVQQLLVQFPKHFEFNSLYLDKLNRHTYANVFGTFSYNSTQERIVNGVDAKLTSLWAYFDSSKRKYKNENYIESDEILRPSFKVRDLHFWKEVYLPPLRSQTPQVPVTSNSDNKFYDSLYLDGVTKTVCK